MAHSDSMFLFEIAIEELKSFTDSKKFRIRCKFADVFTLHLRDPNEALEATLNRQIKYKSKKKKPKRLLSKMTVPSSQAILIASPIETLIMTMKKYPIELWVWSNANPYIVGSSHNPWSSEFIEYLEKLQNNQNVQLVNITKKYHVFDEYSSKRMAILKMRIKLSKLENNSPSSFVALPKGHQCATYGIKSDPVTAIEQDFKEVIENPGVIKTIYNGGKRKFKKFYYRNNDSSKNKSKDSHIEEELKELSNLNKNTNNKSIASLVRSHTDIFISKSKQIALVSTKSDPIIDIKESINPLNYIFGNNTGPFGNKVYCVSYFTVETDSPKASGSSQPTPSQSKTSHSPERVKPVSSPTPVKKVQLPPTASSLLESSAKEDSSSQFKFKVCGSECNMGKATGSCFENICPLDLPEAPFISVGKCAKVVDCDYKRNMFARSPSEEGIKLDLSSVQKDCCQKVEQVVGGVQAKMKIEGDPCYCTCECTFGFTKKTTYCNVCGGYEAPGEDITGKAGQLPFPCPIYHKLVDKSKLKVFSASGSDSKKKVDKIDKLDTVEAVEATEKGKVGAKSKKGAKSTKSDKGSKASKVDKPVKAPKRSKTPTTAEKNVESEKDSKKGKKKNRDNRFKFNYGYQGIPPMIGHDKCILPPSGPYISINHGGPHSGFITQVPKHMGWLWTAQNVPGMKFRPNWRPGASNKHVVRLLRTARYPEEAQAKRRRKETGKPKRPLQRPLLTVAKKEGEYLVTMETMKVFNRQRAPNQYPYEDKPLVTYRIGRTDAENKERMKRRARAARRLEREKRAFIQSTFRDMCQEICMKTYQQALGILPHAEDPLCPCYPAEPGADKVDLEHSCSCSQTSKSTMGSTTDSDEWVVEFTPPNAIFNPKYVTKKVVKVDNSTQYTYLDYRVKLLDRFGNPVPRFFIGPDGKQQCSDLGGFWSPEHKWLEINYDGYIAPDGRWAPNYFIGPNGDQIEAEAGKFQIANGEWIIVGVDGYVDCQGKWRFYPRSRNKDRERKKTLKKSGVGPGGGAGGDRRDRADNKQSEGTWSCFGDATLDTLSKMGIAGHGHDRKLLLSTLKTVMTQGAVGGPQPSKVFAGGGGGGKQKKGKKQVDQGKLIQFMDRFKCRHLAPSDKGIVAVDDHGNKTYFRLRDYKNPRPKERVVALGDKGISLSSFHVPCLSSFISTEMMRQQQYEHILQHNAKHMKSTAAQAML